MSGIKLSNSLDFILHRKVTQSSCCKNGALKANCELSKVWMLMTIILTEAADFLSLESLVDTIPPYGEWNTCIVVFTLFHWAYSIGLE